MSVRCTKDYLGIKRKERRIEQKEKETEECSLFIKSKKIDITPKKKNRQKRGRQFSKRNQKKIKRGYRERNGKGWKKNGQQNKRSYKEVRDNEGKFEEKKKRSKKMDIGIRRKSERNKVTGNKNGGVIRYRN